MTLFTRKSSAKLAAAWAAVAMAGTAQASLPIIGLGTNSFEIDPDSVSELNYTQTAGALVLSNAFPLGATMGGVFGSLASPTSLDLSSYPGLGLQMAISEGFTLNKSFSVQFFASDFTPLNVFLGETSGLNSAGGIAWLSLKPPVDDRFDPPTQILGLADVGGFQFTWDDDSSSNSTTTVFSLVGAEPEGYFVARSPGGFRFITTAATNNLNPSTDFWRNTNGATLPPEASAWLALSDRHAKTGITAIDAREVLRKVTELSVTSWRYRHDPNRRYIGPMAQDFHAAFGLGHDEKHISTLDTDGVTLAALQGLLTELRERQVRSAAQAKRLADLEAELQALQKLAQSSLPPAP
jgi:hypothetical protein